MKKLTEAYANFYLPEESRQLIISKLKNALKEELGAWYGYTIVREWLTGMCRAEVVKLYEETAKDELEDHAYWLMKRINELGGTVDDISVSPSSWLSAIHPYDAPQWQSTGTIEDPDENGKIINIETSLIQNIKGELGAIETYKELVALTEGVDYTTNSKCKEILADEEEHLQLLQEFVDDIKMSK